MARLFTDGDTLSVGAGQIPVATFTQRVVDRLHAEDPRSWRRINAPGPFSDDTVALQVGTSPFNPRTADRYPGSPGTCRFKNFSRHGGRAHVTETDHDARRAWTLHRQVQRGVPALDSA